MGWKAGFSKFFGRSHMLRVVTVMVTWSCQTKNAVLLDWCIKPSSNWSFSAAFLSNIHKFCSWDQSLRRPVVLQLILCVSPKIQQEPIQRFNSVWEVSAIDMHLDKNTFFHYWPLLDPFPLAPPLLLWPPLMRDCSNIPTSSWYFWCNKIIHLYRN